MAKSHPVTTATGTRPAVDLAGKLPARAWQRVCAGPGAKGPRWYDWALIDVTGPAVTEGGGPHWLLIRRRISDGEYAFCRALPARCPWPGWPAWPDRGGEPRTGSPPERGLAAPDGHQVGSWTSWHRWTVLALLARAFLTVLAAAQHRAGHARGDQLIPLACHEIRGLFTGLSHQPPAPAAQLRWSRWRRRHQATACRYRRRALLLPACSPGRGSMINGNALSWRVPGQWPGFQGHEGIRGSMQAGCRQRDAR